jgi:hypothetical protein
LIKNIANIALNPVSLAFFAGLIIILFLPPLFEKYGLRKISHHFLDADLIVSYCDLDHDGFSEKIKYYKPRSAVNNFMVETHGKIIDQWNFSGRFCSGNFFRYCDFDQDGTDEIFVLTYRDDSIFLSGIRPFASDPPVFFRMFVDRFSTREGLIDFTVHWVDDLISNEDGYIDLVISITNAFGLQPRNLYLVDVLNNQIKKSPISGTAISLPIGFDLNNNGSLEYMGRSLAVGNHDPSFPFSDHQAWLMVLNRNMEFLFDPVAFGRHKTWLDVKPFRPSTISYLAALQRHLGHEDIPNLLMLYDIHGNKLKEKEIGEFEMIDRFFLISGNPKKRDDLFLIHSNGTIEKIDSNLMRINSKRLDIYPSNPTRLDVDKDGKDEFIFFGADRHSLVISRNDFSHPAPAVLLRPHHGSGYFSLLEQGDENPVIYFQTADLGYYFEYYKNPLHPIKYMIWLAIVLSLVLFFYILQKIQKDRAFAKFNTEKKIAELQLKSIKSQTDPHFTLNLLDSIGNLFYKKDHEKANYIFGKYARLLRSTILSSDNIVITLEQEIEYVKTFLDLEKFRFAGKFEYAIQCSQPRYLQTEVPKRLIHTFAENAVKHGIRHKREKGFLNISIKGKNNKINIEIHDNGIGREEAKKRSKLSTGKGLEILNTILDLYFNLKNIRITYSITDLTDIDDNPCGTLVVVHIPVRNKK